MRGLPVRLSALYARYLLDEFTSTFVQYKNWLDNCVASGLWLRGESIRRNENTKSSFGN